MDRLPFEPLFDFSRCVHEHGTGAVFGGNPEIHGLACVGYSTDIAGHNVFFPPSGGLMNCSRHPLNTPLASTSTVPLKGQ